MPDRKWAKSEHEREQHVPVEWPQRGRAGAEWCRRRAPAPAGPAAPAARTAPAARAPRRGDAAPAVAVAPRLRCTCVHLEWDTQRSHATGTNDNRTHWFLNETAVQAGLVWHSRPIKVDNTNYERYLLCNHLRDMVNLWPNPKYKTKGKETSLLRELLLPAKLCEYTKLLNSVKHTIYLVMSMK